VFGDNSRRYLDMGMRQVTINVPDDVLASEHLDEAALARELSLLAAVKLYELGRLSSGRAAELAGISHIEFLDALQRYRVFPLESELSDLETGRE
jgi:predicted HTH domain antitoxin